MKKFTQDERHEIKRVLDRVLDVMETTDNDISFEVSFIGVDLHSYAGKMDTSNPHQEYAISDDAAYHCPFTKADADRMIMQLNVLSHFNKAEKETDTTDEE